jgi:hypothetical protein
MRFSVKLNFTIEVKTHPSHRWFQLMQLEDKSILFVALLNDDRGRASKDSFGQIHDFVIGHASIIAHSLRQRKKKHKNYALCA